MALQRGRARRAGRTLLTMLIAGGLIIVATVVAYNVGRSRPGTDQAPSIGSASPRSIASVEAFDAAPTGCLGGADLSSSMLLEAQRQAPQTTYGAVEVAAAFLRWAYRYPTPTRADVADATGIFIPANATAAKRALLADYRRNPNPSGGVIENGTAFSLSTATGRWTVDDGAEGEAVISIEATFVSDGSLSSTESIVESFRMRQVRGAWRVASLQRADPSALAAGGTAFTAGC